MRYPPHGLRCAESPVPAPKRGLVDDDTSDTRVVSPIGEINALSRWPFTHRWTATSKRKLTAEYPSFLIPPSHPPSPVSVKA